LLLAQKSFFILLFVVIFVVAACLLGWQPAAEGKIK
jgi:hypothetical protein